jgi:hypothetical protein
MIIKFEVNGAWQMYDDVDSLQYRKLDPLAVAGDFDNPKEIIDFTETFCQGACGKEGNPGRVLLTFMNSKQLVESQICAFSPIYVMNEQGRTVETI